MTVVGARRRVDLAVPAETAIAEYVPALLRLVGQMDFDDTFPPVWSLGLPGATPLAPERSLRECGIADGATLYLSDAGAGEYDEPVVTDLEETVAQADEGISAWSRRSRAYTTLVLGILSLIAGFVALVGTADGNAVMRAAGVGAVVVVFSLTVLVRQATRQEWSLPLGLRLTMACAAIPLLAVAAATLAPPGSSAAFALVAPSAGAVLGALAALLAIRHVATLVAVVITGLAGVLTVCLALAHASRMEVAAVVGVAMTAMLGAAPGLSGHLAVLAESHADRADQYDDEAVLQLVQRGQWLLIGMNILLSGIAATCLVVLGSADQGFAVALACTLGLALILRAGRLTMAPAVVPVVAAGAIGLAATLVRAPGTLGAPDWVGPVALVGAAVLASAVGLSRAFRADGGDERRPWIDPLAGFLTVACVPLAVGVFGVYAMLASSGHAR